jgi:hypothetical protein
MGLNATPVVGRLPGRHGGLASPLAPVDDRGSSPASTVRLRFADCGDGPAPAGAGGPVTIKATGAHPPA